MGLTSTCESPCSRRLGTDGRNLSALVLGNFPLFGPNLLNKEEVYFYLKKKKLDEGLFCFHVDKKSYLIYKPYISFQMYFLKKEVLFVT